MMNFSSSSVKEYTSNGFNLSTMLKSVAIAIAVSIILLFIFSFIVTFTPYPQELVSLGIVMILIISNLVGGWLTAKGAQSNGWFNGAVAGAIYMLLLFIVGSFINGFSITANTLLMTSFGLLSGAVGGIFGVNLKPKRR